MTTKSIKHIPEILEKDQLVISGMSAISPLNIHVSPSRLAMLTSHLRQMLDLCVTDVNTLMSGLELDLAKHCFNVSADCNMKVLHVVPRFETVAIMGNGRVIDYTIVYQDMDTGEYGHLVLKNYISNSPGFGSELKPTKATHRIAKDAMFEKDTVFMNPECVKENGNYGIGRNVNTAFMAMFATAEDGYRADEVWQEMFQFNAYQHVNEDLQPGHVLTNTYGNSEVIKVVPTLGDRIRDDGVVFNIRKIDPLTAGLALSNRWLGKIIQKYDRPYIVQYPGAEVIDITVIKTAEQNDMPLALREQLDALAKATIDYRTTLLDLELDIYRRHRETYGTNAKAVFKADFSRLLVESRAIFNIGLDMVSEEQIKRLSVLIPKSDKTGRIKLIRKQKALGPYSISLTLKYKEKPGIGQKLTNFFGNLSKNYLAICPR